MIADMRGFTRFTQERGDEAAADLANSFAQTTRQVVVARDGLLLELRGDEALVVFDSARQAIRTALELHARLGDVASNETPSLPVGVGLDAGEAVSVETGFRGERSTSPGDSALSRPLDRPWPLRPSFTSQDIFRA